MAHLEAARTAFERVIDLTPDDAGALSALGEIRLATWSGRSIGALLC